MDDLPVQLAPLSMFAAIVLGLTLLLALRARLRAAARIATVGELRRLHGTADKDVVQLFPVDGGPSRLAVIAGGMVGIPESGDASGMGTRLRAVEQATLLFDGAGRVGLRVALTGNDAFVAVDLDGIVRLYDRLNEAGVALRYEIAPGADARIQQKVRGLHEKEQALLQEWLQADKGEVLLDVVPGVAYAGRVPTPGSPVKVTMVVTNVRLSLLVQTQTVQQSGNTRRTTTHFSCVGYPLPLVEQVVVARTGGVRRQRCRWSFRWKPEAAPAADRTPPDLLLDAHSGAAVFPLAICKVDVQAETPRLSPTALVGPWLRGAIGFGLLGASLGAVPVWIYWGAGGSAERWAFDWIATAGLCGAIAAASLRCLSAYELFQQRRAEAALVGGI